MRNSRFAISRLALVILVVASTLLVSAPSAFANVRVPGGDVPFYARLGRNEIYHNDDWAAIVFYRPPGCIPAGFNLLDFFDIPAALGCQPHTTTGFEIWTNGPGIDPAPKLAKFQGLGAVPVWFVPWPALQAAVADDVLTIGELAALQPLVGSASAFHETLRPTQVVRVGTIELNATGTLSDGRTFEMHFQGAGELQEPLNIHVQVRIVFR